MDLKCCRVDNKQWIQGLHFPNCIQYGRSIWGITFLDMFNKSIDIQLEFASYLKIYLKVHMYHILIVEI